MTGRRPPTWADRRTNTATLGPCPACHRPVIRAHVEGRAATADPLPLDAAAELEVKLTGEWTYDLVLRAAGARLYLRYPWHLPHRHHPVIGPHTCPGPEPEAPEPAQGRLF